MAFHEVQFPTDISYGSEGGPEFSTDVIEIGNGYERRTQNWSAPRARWNVAYGVNTKARLVALIDFFMARRGRAHGFRFKDHDDYQVSAESMVYLTNTTYQIVRRYGDFVRTIQKPVAGTVVVLRSNGTVYPVNEWTVDTTTGIVTFTTAPSSGPKATCEFDVPCRFDQDYLPRRFEAYEARSASVMVVEYKL